MPTRTRAVAWLKFLGWLLIAAVVTGVSAYKMRSRIPTVDAAPIKAMEPRELVIVSGDVVGVTGEGLPVLKMYRTADTVVLYTRCAP